MAGAGAPEGGRGPGGGGGGQFPATPRSAGAERLPEEEGGRSRGVRVRGWDVRTGSGGILGQAGIDAAERALGTTHLPELFFGDSFLEMKHRDSGVCLRFGALEALKEWREEALPPLRVAVASAWKQSRVDTLKKHGVKDVDYDWTFTTPFAGASTGPSDLIWEETKQTIDRELLMRRDPILFFDDVALFESELDDYGDAKLNVKVRVMASSIYVLQRFWLRVDGMLVRLRETRVFVPLEAPEDPDTGCPVIVREVKHMAGSMEELTAAGAPCGKSAHSTADGTALVFEAVAPVGLERLEVRQAHILD